MKRRLEEVTPERAREILATYESGNKPDEKKLERFKNMMIDGTWKTNKSFFINIRGGKLMNGKHRLTAVAETGITQILPIQYEP